MNKTFHRSPCRNSISLRLRKFWVILLAAILPIGAGCSSKFYFMPTPNIYAKPDWNPFSEVPPALQGDTVSVLYVTDRAPEKNAGDRVEYGYRRSRSAAYGEAIVRFGDGSTSWDEIVSASRTEHRNQEIEVSVAEVRELARFGKTPPKLVLTDAELAQHAQAAAADADADAQQRFRREIAARLAKTPRKEVFIYVHGFNNSFDAAVMTTGELWHFVGREGVPVCYTWPAGMGSIKAYEYTLASTEFTIYHFKQTLRLIASCPEVEKIHILAHSRGTAVTTDTIRELHIEIRGTADTQKTLKLGTVVLAAADIDLDVAIARNGTERIARAVEQSAIYISKVDKALGFSTWLFGGLGRLGALDVSVFEKSEIEGLRGSRRLQLIDARVKSRGAFGHSYFTANPAISSDILLLMRYQLPPGAQHGRPLGVSENGLWYVDDGYPGPAWKAPASPKP